MWNLKINDTIRLIYKTNSPMDSENKLIVTQVEMVGVGAN